jgi:Pyruvate/2-oxoacid:ferredoxin oxidoreductase delta subunit
MGDNVSSIKAENCSGCALCFAICPRKAITMRYNEEGFFYPVVDEKKCNRCGLCYEKCPFRKIINRNNYRHPESWSCWHKSEQVVMASSSGGAFTALAEEILSRKGIIYGASYNPDLSVSHVRIPSKDSLSVVKKIQIYPERYFKDLWRGRKGFAGRKKCSVCRNALPDSRSIRVFRQ